MSRATPIVRPVILCGGSGTRLWPMSRKNLPKQFLPLVSKERTLLQETVLRAVAVSHNSAPIAICNEEHRFLLAGQMSEVGISAQVILEPEGRNTAAAIAVAALTTQADDPVLLILASDHSIEDAAFKPAAGRAIALAEQGWLVTFGIRASRPESGFGYIVRGDAIGNDGSAFHVARFIEKPPASEAQKLLSAGDAYWNSGLFAFRSSRILEELERYRPDIVAAARLAVESSASDLGFLRLGKDEFLACPSESIDKAVMENTDKAVVVPSDFGWSDVGSWNALWDIANKDSDGNAARGDVRMRDTRNSLVFSDRRFVATLGVENLVIVETDDALLVADRSRSQEVREIVDTLNEAKRTEHVNHTRVYRPWGYYENLDSGPGYLVKRIMVKPGAALSLQKHHHRAEHWVVVSGQARVTRGTEVTALCRNQSVFIPVSEVHRLENPGTEELHLIEVQSGDKISEEDIVRYEDLYKR